MGWTATIAMKASGDGNPWLPDYTNEAGKETDNSIYDHSSDTGRSAGRWTGAATGEFFRPYYVFGLLIIDTEAA